MCIVFILFKNISETGSVLQVDILNESYSANFFGVFAAVFVRLTNSFKSNMARK